MKTIKIELEETLKHSISTGINLFLGSGFSILASDSNNRPLPTASQLSEELAATFKVPKNLSLDKQAAILDKTRKYEFRTYLQKRFSVNSFPDEYNNIRKLNTKGIFTTNIDNLVNKIYEKDSKHILNDLAKEGHTPNIPNSIRFCTLHGSIIHEDRPLIFTPIEIATTFSDSPRLWQYLTHSIEEYPTIFWGYSMNDAGVFQALFSDKITLKEQKPRWILVQDEKDELIEYYRAIGFNIIFGDTTQLLNYIGDLPITQKPHTTTTSLDADTQFETSEKVPLSNKGLPARPIKQFFLGEAPIWSDIFSGNIRRVSYYSKIKDKIFGKKHVAILGTPASGKSTLLMQLATSVDVNGIKLIYFDPITSKKALNIITNLNMQKAIIFIDNFADSIEAVDILSKSTNVTLVLTERTHNYSIISHLITTKLFDFYNITKLSDHDKQEIYSSIPETIRREISPTQKKGNYDDESLFEFISKNIKSASLRDRIESTLHELEHSESNLTDLLIVCCYVHYCRTPISFEMLLSYFIDLEYQDIFEMKVRLEGMITDYKGPLIDDFDQDYYYPRSIIFAETVLEATPSGILKNILLDFMDNVPNFLVCHYDIFKRKAYDKNLMLRAFTNWRDGMEFYEKAFAKDYGNAYILQQGALYLASKLQYTEAFYWIDRALNISDNKIFSIRNSHAIILFSANINSLENNNFIRAQLDESMNILKKCYKDDKRKVFHAITYAEQALKYYDRYPDSFSFEHLRQAKVWLNDVQKDFSWNKDIPILISHLNKYLD